MRTVVGRNEAHVVPWLRAAATGMLDVLNVLHRIQTTRLIERARNCRKMATRLGIFVAAFQAVGPLRRRCTDIREPRDCVGRHALHAPPAAKFVPLSDPMNSPWNPPALFIHRPCRSG